MSREEVDLLGAKSVPDDAYFGVHTQRAVENFPISGKTVSDYPEFVRGMVQVKKAAALANREARVISQETADAIVAGCDLLLDQGVALDQFPVDLFQGGAGTSVNMNTNEVVANLALETMELQKGDYGVIHPNDDVNKSQSTNDAYPTGLKLAVYRRIQALADELEALADAFDRLGDKNQHVIKMGRTQLQDAVPMSIGQEFVAFGDSLRQEVRHLRRESLALLTVNLGGTAIGTGVNTPADFQELVVTALGQVTGLPIRGAKNMIQATSDTGDFVSAHSALKQTAGRLSKISNDLRLLSSGPRAGLNEINLPELQAGSSIMPAKVNPVIPEVVNQICFKVFGNDVTVWSASEAGQLQLNVMEPVMAQCLFESSELLEQGAKVLREKCVDGITVNEEVCRDYVEQSIGVVTYLTDIIGHDEGDSVGKECAATGKTVREVVVERGLLTHEELNEVFAIENLLNPTYVGTLYPAPGEEGD